jgi:hypothetical protein
MIFLGMLYVILTGYFFYITGYNAAYQELDKAGLFDQYKNEKGELELEYLDDDEE